MPTDEEYIDVFNRIGSINFCIADDEKLKEWGNSNERIKEIKIESIKNNLLFHKRGIDAFKMLNEIFIFQRLDFGITIIVKSSSAEYAVEKANVELDRRGFHTNNTGRGFFSIKDAFLLNNEDVLFSEIENDIDYKLMGCLRL